VFLAGLVATSVFAVPQYINYSGRVVKNGILINTPQVITINLYTQALGGAAFWTTVNPSIPFYNGIYNYDFGPIDPSVLLGKDTVYLQTEIGGEILLPRTKTQSGAFALQAGGLSHDGITINAGTGMTTVVGTLNATKFIGDGSALSGLPISGLTTANADLRYVSPNYTGNVSINGVLDMKSNKITNLTAPINPADAATMAYVQTYVDAAGASGKLSGQGNFTDTCVTADAIGARCSGGYKAGTRLIVQPAGCPQDSVSNPTCTDLVDTATYTWNDGSSNWYDIPALDNASDSRSGSANTNTIYLQNNTNGVGIYKAANYCNGLVLNGSSDWFLPNLGELFVIYKNALFGVVPADGLRGFAPSSYWSSSEYTRYQRVERQLSQWEPEQLQQEFRVLCQVCEVLLVI
jgi:hypothetical protein